MRQRDLFAKSTDFSFGFLWPWSMRITGLFHVGYTEYRHLQPAQVREIQGTQREYNEYLVRLIVAAQGAGEAYRDMDPRTCAGAIFALLNSIIWWRRPGSQPNIEVLISTYERMLLGGLSTRCGAGQEKPVGI